MASIKVSVVDSKLRKHSVDVPGSAPVAHVKLLLANMSLVPAGFVPILVYQKRMLSDDECLGSIGYSPERSLSLVCVRSTSASTAADPALQSSRSTESNPPAAALEAPASPAAAAGSAAAHAATAAAHVPALVEARPLIFCMGFDEALVRRALDRTGGNEQDAIEILISGTGQLHPDESPSLSSSRDAALPVIFSMGFDDALVRRALASAGGDEQRAVELLLSGGVPSSEKSSSMSANVRKAVPVGASAPVPAPALGSSASAVIPSSASSSAPPPPAINFATEWLDEDSNVCPKNVEYATQCPKGHALAPFVCSGGPQAQQPSDADDVICRVCHGSTQRQHACDWLVCSVAACCGGYAVCAACVTALGSARRAAAARPDDFCMMVMPLACELKQCLASSLLWLCVFDFALTSIFRAFPCSICSCCRRSSAAHGGVV
jgi:hypothetical protein